MNDGLTNVKMGITVILDEKWIDTSDYVIMRYGIRVISGSIGGWGVYVTCNGIWNVWYL